MTRLNRAATAALFAFVVIGMALFSSWANAQLRQVPLTIQTSGGPVALEIELAETPDQQSKGLMFRKSLGERAGMLFSYAPAKEITMWMRNTYIPLDMLFVRADGVIHRIEVMTQPFSEDIIPSQGEVTAVLELNGGAAAKLGIKPGDRVQHTSFGTGR